MIVGIMAKTTDLPLTLIGSVAGISTARCGNGKERARNCFKLGHLSVFEHVSVTWRVSGISRACSHQLVRHRLASYCQMSQRYTRVVTESSGWYVAPQCAKGDDSIGVEFELAMAQCAAHYRSLVEKGVKPEDARYVLPEATRTNIAVTMNMREFMSFYALRTDKAAQWEIRELAERMLDTLESSCGEWEQFAQMVKGGIDGKR